MLKFLSHIDWSVVAEVVIGYLSGKGILNSRNAARVVLAKVLKKKPAR